MLLCVYMKISWRKRQIVEDLSIRLEVENSTHELEALDLFCCPRVVGRGDREVSNEGFLSIQTTFGSENRNRKDEGRGMFSCLHCCGSPRSGKPGTFSSYPKLLGGQAFSVQLRGS